MVRLLLAGLLWLALALPAEAQNMSAVRDTVRLTANLLATVANTDATVLVKNTGAGTVYLGPADVTALTGYALPTATTLTLDLRSGSALYGICAADTNIVQVLMVDRR